MDLRSIEIFLAICEQGGFTAAGHALGLTQAAVSQHITKLERELGVGLIDRAIRPQKLTAAGQHLQRRGRVLLDDLHRIQAELKHYRNYQIPALRLGLIESVAGAMLPLIVQGFAGKVGSLSITSGTTHPLMPELRAGNFDLLVTSEQTDEHEALRCECLLVEPVVLVLPKGTPAPKTWDDMRRIAADLEFVSYGMRRRIGRIVNRLIERHELATRGSLSFDSSLALFDRVRAGGSWGASTPMCLLSAGASVKDFEIATFPGAVPIRSLNAVWRAECDGVEIEIAIGVIRKIIADNIYSQLLDRAGGASDRIHLPGEETPIAAQAC